jgi:hypothetical protein
MNCKGKYHSSELLKARICRKEHCKEGAVIRSCLFCVAIAVGLHMLNKNTYQRKKVLCTKRRLEIIGQAVTGDIAILAMPG